MIGWFELGNSESHAHRHSKVARYLQSLDLYADQRVKATSGQERLRPKPTYVQHQALTSSAKRSAVRCAICWQSLTDQTHSLAIRLKHGAFQSHRRRVWYVLDPESASEAARLNEIKGIDKPRSLSSAQVVRDLQKAFNPSRLFAPLLAAERAVRNRENAFQRKRRRDKRLQLKIGHGGTLDPLATGVLVIGVGKGTKQLSRFLECTKSYDATLLFGAATDTYDILGQELARAPYSHISNAGLESALQTFRGVVMQKPPIYSAIRMQGKRLYEYAREGLELPTEIQARPVTVEELDATEWLKPGSHDLRLPLREAEDAEKAIASQLLHLGGPPGTEVASEQALPPSSSASTLGDYSIPDGKTLDNDTAVDSNSVDRDAKKSSESPAEDQQGEPSKPQETDPSATPLAVKLHMTVTSGFYVRSLCHDLGRSLGSLAVMAALSRTRQGQFELGRNVLDYEDLAKGEDVWGPKVKSALDDWNLAQPSEDAEAT